MSKNKWYGSNMTVGSSIFSNDESGMVMRRKSKGFYEVYAQLGDMGYTYGTFWFDGWVKNLDEENEWEHLGKTIGIDADEYRNMVVEGNHDYAALMFLSDLMSIYGIDELLGYTAYEPPIYTENEVKIRLNKALAA